MTSATPRKNRGLPTLGGGQWWSDIRWRAGFRIQQYAGQPNNCRLLDPNDWRVARGSLNDCLLALPGGEGPKDVVVLLHGLGRRSRSMKKLAAYLEAKGQVAICLDYASTRASLDDHATCVGHVLAHLPGTERVSFVTHSLGGIVARKVMAEHWPSHLEARRLVMLAPPSTSATLAKRLDSSAFRWVMGPAASELARGHRAPPPSIPFAIIAGSLNAGRGINPMLDGDDDGIVSVAETRLEGAAAHYVVKSLHTTIMNHDEAQSLAHDFLTADQRRG